MEFKLKDTTYMIDDIVSRHEVLTEKTIEGIHRYCDVITSAMNKLIAHFQRPKKSVGDVQALATSDFHSAWKATAIVVQLFYNGLEESLTRTTQRTSQEKRRGEMTNQQLESLLLCHFYGSRLKWLMDEAIIDGARMQKYLKLLLEMGEAFCKDAPRSRSNAAVISSVMLKHNAHYWNNLEHFVLPEFEESKLPAMLAARQAVFLLGDRFLEKVAMLKVILGEITLSWAPSQFMPVGGWRLLMTENALGTRRQLANAPWMDSFPIQEWKTRDVAQKFETICLRFAEKVLPQHASRQGAPNSPLSTPENVAEQEATEEKVEEPTQNEEVKTDEEAPTTVVTPVQEQEIAVESLVATSPSDVKLPERAPDTPTYDEPEDELDPTEAPAPEDSPTVDIVPLATAAPISTTTRPPVVTRTIIKPTVPVATEDRQDVDEDPVKPIIATKPGEPRNDSVDPHAVRAEVASYKPNPEAVWKPTTSATEAHKVMPWKPRDVDESAPARMPGHTAASHRLVAGLNETAHHAHGDQAKRRVEPSTAHSVDSGFD